MLLLSLTITCPACGSRVASDARSCPHCTGLARSWPGPALRPLLLPGGPTVFSDDVLDQSRRERRLVSGTIAMSVLLATSLIAGRIADDKRDQHSVIATQIGSIAPPESGTVVWATLRPLPAPEPEPAQAVAPRPLMRMKRVAEEIEIASRAQPIPVQLTSAQQPFANAMAVQAPAVQAPAALATATQARVTQAMATQASATPSTPWHAPRFVSRDESAESSIAPAVPIAATRAAPQRALALRIVQGPAIPRDSMFAAAASRLDDNEVRSAITHFVAALPARSAINGDLMAFYGNGAEHHVVIADEPETVGGAPTSVRVMFDIRLSKYDAIGRHQTRILPVSMIVAKRDGDVTASAVTFGTLRKP